MKKSVLSLIETVAQEFRHCFSRQAAWGWFVVLIVGFMLRSDKLGITSVIRDLALAPRAYEALIHFFRAASWNLDEISECWYRIVKTLAPLCLENGFFILLGDGVKQSKEARRMPGVKRMHQESENSGKAASIFGHLFGGLGILAGGPGLFACIPLSLRLHDGLRETANWAQQKGCSAASHVVQMIENAANAARVFGNSLLLLDRYFLTVPALETLAALNAVNAARLELISRAKKNCVAYEKPGPRKPGPGRPRLKGEAVHLGKLFDSRKEDFQTAMVEVYGKTKSLQYLCVNLLWGQKLYQELRFVLVEMDGIRSIFVSTDLTLNPLTIVQLYSRRFSIECCFRELKQQIGAFCYRFWTKHMPRLSHFQKKNTPSPLEEVTTTRGREKVLLAAKAIEMHMGISCISMGILQILSLRFVGKVDSSELRYLRTPSRGRVSEATLMDWLRRNIFQLLFTTPHSPVSRIILDAQKDIRKDQAG